MAFFNRQDAENAKQFYKVAKKNKTKPFVCFAETLRHVQKPPDYAE